MRVALFVVFVSVLTTPSEASNSCMSKNEARQHFGSVHIYWHGKDHCWDATSTRQHHQIHTVRQKIRLHTVQEKNHQPKWHDSMSEILPAEASVQTPSVARQVDIEPPPSPSPSPPPQISIAERWVDIVQVAPPLAIRKPEPLVTPRGVVMVMVIITIILTITIFELLFGGIRWAGPILARLQDARPRQDATADVDARQV
jgi:hypothetical protein